ncbi:hypothetical protein GE300_08910 [Rhodobacteraceae bacterium 2CG4]|uniref:Uncharacterized protein n=1 Tax=Halovulum marinum TaxID=2662447 RepID=A0A6L5YZQ3_9RHOB|nr:hypothetical protein [Halovulum marinum]MSU89737.1 hypothetical protein [Halovulum marinum]
MRRFTTAFVLGAALLAAPDAGHAAGITENACLRSQRSPGPTACRCAQSLADFGLTRRDQREAARIIAEPDRYLKHRERRASQAFLQRYHAWGAAAERSCRG